MSKIIKKITAVIIITVCYITMMMTRAPFPTPRMTEWVGMSTSAKDSSSRRPTLSMISAQGNCWIVDVAA